MHELVVRARQLASVAKLVRVLHWNRRAADGSILARGLACVQTVSALSTELQNLVAKQ